MQLFNFEGNQLRTIDNSGDPWFVAKDVCAILEIGNASDAVRRLDDDEKGIVSIDTLGGKQDVVGVNEAGLYGLILGSRKTEAKTFKRWIKHEVLPSIRKHGAYMTPETIEKTLRNPDFIIQLATRLKEETARADEATRLVAELKPKASYCELVLQSKSVVPVSIIAKDYGMSGMAMNKMLHELGIQYKLGDCWVLYQKHADKGYTQSKTQILDAEKSKIHTYWTHKGRLFLYEFLKERDVLPVIERAA